MSRRSVLRGTSSVRSSTFSSARLASYLLSLNTFTNSSQTMSCRSSQQATCTLKLTLRLHRPSRTPPLWCAVRASMTCGQDLPDPHFSETPSCSVSSTLSSPPIFGLHCSLGGSRTRLDPRLRRSPKKHAAMHERADARDGNDPPLYFFFLTTRGTSEFCH